MGITKELNKKPLLNCYSIYIKYSWSMLLIIKPAFISMLHSYIYLISPLRPLGYILYSNIIFQIFPLCSRPMTSYYVTYKVTVISCASLSSKKLKEKKKKKKIDKKILVFKSFYNNIYKMYKSNNKQLRYWTINNYKSFIG